MLKSSLLPENACVTFLPCPVRSVTKYRFGLRQIECADSSAQRESRV